MGAFFFAQVRQASFSKTPGAARFAVTAIPADQGTAVMIPLRISAPVVVLAILTAQAHAETFEDSRSGIRITVDDAFSIASEPVAGQPDARMIFISSRNAEHPFVPGSISPVCVFTQWPDPEFAGLDQSAINADAPNWPTDIITDMAGSAELESATPFEHQGLAGMEVVTRLTQSVTNEEYLVFFALGTPAGRASLACAATSQTLPLALAAYRHMRDGITLQQ